MKVETKIDRDTALRLLDSAKAKIEAMGNIQDAYVAALEAEVVELTAENKRLELLLNPTGFEEGGGCQPSK